MLNSDIDCDEEDEDVVIAGSELHEALSKMGYSDYELVPISDQKTSSVTRTSYKLDLKQKSDGWVSEIVYKKLFNVYRCMIKDRSALRNQLTIISGAQHLLDDHADLIKSLLNEDCEKGISGTNRFLLSCLKYAAVTTVGYYFINRSNPITWLVTLPAIATARYKYNKWRSDRDLKRLISEQTELHYSYKRSLRILSDSFRMNTDVKQSGLKFSDLGAEKLKLLQTITERTVQSLGTMSSAYYQTTLEMAELLPELYRQDFDHQITYFDPDCFTNCGEITYNGLKQLFYRFILIQSEMLLSLAVARHSDPDDLCNDIKREMKINHRVKQLLQFTTEHRISMMKTVESFQKRKLTAVENKHRGFPGSKWQDLYVRLHLTSRKMEKAYDAITFVLAEIENHLDRRTDEAELMVYLKTRLDDVYQDVDKARDLAQLSALVVSKMGQMRKNLEKQDGDEDNDAMEISRRDIPVVRDTEPEIIDEVFEEYIRERYSEALMNEAGDDYLEKTYKLDKLLSRNLMSELKEALVDKQKDTRERESRALKRMNKGPNNDEIEDVSNGNSIPLDRDAEIASRDLRPQVELELPNGASKDHLETGEQDSSCIPKPPPPPIPKEFNLVMSGLGKVEEIEDRLPISFVPLPNSRSIPLPLFLSINEETFIGSGENSDQEVVDESDSEEEKNEDEEKKETVIYDS